MSESNSYPRGERPLPAAWTDNPFQAPAAHVADVRTGADAGLAGEPASVASGRGIGWWSAGWGLYREATGVWVGICVVLLLFSAIPRLVPIVGIVSYLLFPIFTGGLMLGCKAIEDGEGLSFGHLFAGFQTGFGQLVKVGALYLGGIVAIGIVAFIVGLGGALAGGPGAVMLIVVLLALGAAIPLAMAIWFAPALVVLHGLDAVAAMKLSFHGCRRNLMPFLVFGLLGMVLAVVATIPFGVGWLLLVPTTIAASYAAYKDIFLA